MQRERALGSIERGCWLIDQTAPMNVVAIAAVRGAIELPRLHAALAAVQRRHPLLRVCVQVQADGPAFFSDRCAIPVVRMARVSFGGTIKEISLAYTPEAKTGDYVLAHVGFALQTIDEEEAQKTLELLRQLGDAME